MKAVVVREHGGLDALRYEDVPDPTPGPGEALIEVRATAANHLDVWMRRGLPGVKVPLPLVLGNDVAGVVLDPNGCRGLSAGDEVVLAPGLSCGRCHACLGGQDHLCREYGILGEHRDGGWAERVAVPWANVLRKPARLSFEQAAAVPLTFLTAWHMLVARAQLRPGETVLVQAAGSGVGVAAVQIAKLWGATVIATAGSAKKLERARALGADHAVDHREQDVAKVVKGLTQGRGADVVFEHTGADTWAQSVAALTWAGRLVTCGATTGPVVQLNLVHLFFKSQSLLGSTMGSKGELCQVLRHVEAGRLEPVIDRVLPLAEAREAQRVLEAREAFGKVVLTPARAS